MRIAITGGAGFIGYSLASHFVGSHEIVIIDDFSRGVPRDFSVFDNHSVSVVRVDITEPDALEAVLSRSEVVIHCAAIAGIDSVVREPVRTLHTNIFGTYNLLDACSRSPQIQRVVLFSTSEVYGRFASNASEDQDCVVSPATQPRWSYAASKIVDEHLGFAFLRQFQVPVVVVRPFNVYGPGQLGEGAIKNFIQNALAGNDLVVRGHPTNIRSWCFIDDLVDCVVRAVHLDGSVGKIFNVGNPDAISTTSDLAKLVLELAGPTTSKIVVDPAEHIDVISRIPDITKAREILGFTPRIGLRDGIMRTIVSQS